MKPVLLLSTAGSSKEAESLAKLLLKKRVAACVNIVPRIDSWYWWQGKMEHGKEFLLLIKTSSKKVQELVSLLKKTHSYQVPELLVLPIQLGERSYINWLFDTLKSSHQE